MMNLPIYSSMPIRLADGSETLLSVHSATIIWDDLEKVVPVLASGYKPLLGVALMEGYHLEIDFEENGLVSLEKISSVMSVESDFYTSQNITRKTTFSTLLTKNHLAVAFHINIPGFSEKSPYLGDFYPKPVPQFPTAWI